MNNRIIPIPMDITPDCTLNYAAAVHWGIICFQCFSVINSLLCVFTLAFVQCIIAVLLWYIWSLKNNKAHKK